MLNQELGTLPVTSQSPFPAFSVGKNLGESSVAIRAGLLW